MAYPPPPGLSSLPSRPPPVASSSSTDSPTPTSSSFRSPPASSNPWSPPTAFPPAFNSGGNGRNIGHSQYGAPPASPSYGAPPASYGMSAPPASYGAPPSYGGGHAAAHQPYRGSATGGYGPSMPHIQNPFPAPGTVAAAASASDYDPEMAAALATWQSAYVTRDAGGPDKIGMQRTGTEASLDSAVASPYPTGEETANADDAEQTRKKTVAREGGGKKWTDDSLLEWDPSHLRIFVGNLGGETTDNSLLGAFSRWSSVQKARVIRDKRTNKSKGYGFVSFSDADDFFSAAKEMNGKYIGSHPVVIRKANTEIKVVKSKDNDGRGGNGRYNRNNRNNNNRERNRQRDDEKKAAETYEPNLGPINAGRVTKPGQKTKNGLRLLG